MTHSYIRLLFVTVIAACFAASCSKETPVSYTNPLDPSSPTYVPTSPGNLVAVARPDSGVSLTWNDRSRGEEGFILERKVNWNGIYLPIDTLSSGCVKYFDRFAVLASTNYFYRMLSFKGETKGKYSNEGITVFYFPNPSKITITPLTKTSLKLEWTFDPSFTIDGFILERSINNETYILAASLDKNATSYIDNHIDTTNSYRYRIKGFTKNNQGPYSQESAAEYIPSGIEKLFSVSLGRSVVSLAFSPDGKLFGAGGINRGLCVWNTSDGKIVQNFNSGTDNCISSLIAPIAFSADGSMVASEGDGTNGSSIHVWSVKDGSFVKDLHSTVGQNILSLCFLRGNTEIAGGSLNGEIRIWNIARDSIRLMWTSEQWKPITFLYPITQGTRIISGSSDNALLTWSTASLWLLSWQSDLPSSFYSVSTDEQYFTSGESVRFVSSGVVKAAFRDFSAGRTRLTYDNAFLLGKTAQEITVGKVSDASLLVTLPLSNPDDYTQPTIAASPISNIFISTGNTTGTIDMWKMRNDWRFK